MGTPMLVHKENELASKPLTKTTWLFANLIEYRNEKHANATALTDQIQIEHEISWSQSEKIVSEILALLGHINIMKRRDQKKYVTFEIDPRLERIWKAIGLTDEERASEMKIIENALIETYEQQIARNRDRMEKMRQKLHDEELSFEQTKKRFGDKETLLHTSSSSSRGGRSFTTAQ